MTNQRGSVSYGTVTGAVELKTKDNGEIERFVRGHLESLEDRELTVRLSKEGFYLAELCCAKEPTT
jgi:hypothetical protein